MKAIISICLVVLAIFIYKNPTRTADVKMKDGTIISAYVPVIVGKVSVGEKHPMFKGLFGEYVIGTVDELDKTEQVEIIKTETAW